ncbi:hypothetical protein [Pleomorphomonas sp. JP5]|uniref:hypothetical protein n=1 Tax=Pleomorphomonas sp. JP5 TaxID=2942998 RepID=UPI002044A46E|nr:hypothetical protein [Pleomorphomonas sp. JP5]MCM5556724.1 hypothetical protein [Pleomorphomonas sp. JP5]
MRILYPHEPEEKAAALQEAAFKPALFNELREKWPDRAPSDEALRSYLTRNGFSQGALDQVIQFYRETLDIASASEPADNDGRHAPIIKDASMETAPAIAPVVPAPVPTPPPLAGRPFTVSFDGSTLTGTLAIRSVRDIDRLIKVLQAQKAALEAMIDDDDAIDDDDLI